MNTIPRIWAISDIHGSYKPIENFYNRNKNTIDFSPETDIMIVLGDFGGNFFFTKRDKEFKWRLEQYNLTFFVIRGNHEERPSICATNNAGNWHTEEFFDNTVYVENDYPYIKYALDEPAVYNIPNKEEFIKYDPPKIDKNDNITLAELNIYTYRTLVIPGAYSVDKYYRIHQGWTWFPNEQLTQEEMDSGRRIIEQNPHFDLVLSHTCPTCYEPTDLFLSVVDQSTVDKTMERYLAEIEYNIDYKLYLFGHYHAHRVYPYHEGKQKIMLYNEKVINVNEWIENLPNISKTY